MGVCLAWEKYLGSVLNQCSGYRLKEILNIEGKCGLMIIYAGVIKKKSYCLVSVTRKCMQMSLQPGFKKQ